MLQCYNRGCGQLYDPVQNTEESCQHHPGMPFFHDAYKGWTCCNKKSVDFTEFLNMKGCSFSKHSNVKPAEPEKLAATNVEKEFVRKPILVALDRPPFDTDLIKIEPEVTAALKEAVDALLPKAVEPVSKLDVIENGTICKNSGCKHSYTSKEVEGTECQYHPGAPIFHEGMKFWSCCKRRTTDFTVFMNQPGCSQGKHKWKDDATTKKTSCRFDWHQTPSNVIVAIYAKLYDYEKSSILMNPIRLKVDLFFPDEVSGTFNIDLELRGLVDVDKSAAKMYPTKIEIIMPKAEACSWPDLSCERNLRTDKETFHIRQGNSISHNDSDSEVDLDDIMPSRK
ncbi:unnamed protein product [Hermetia illucens]|uniref:Cysteine and histidine-rich domain-containing protein n=1 Tax=Hermetia illucens TaxID=343691 RepID=A0A7R8UR02_HERIL|nr:cysteine and histidine-rich domain-containing protein [Hermetia illucens]CAD7085389.1 unnamed protein product [Hermetia illucens]